MKTEIKVGDRVAYKAKFLRDIGDYSHARASQRGTVTAIDGWLATVAWEATANWPAVVRGCHVGNLVRADRIHLEPV